MCMGPGPSRDEYGLEGRIMYKVDMKPMPSAAWLPSGPPSHPPQLPGRMSLRSGTPGRPHPPSRANRTCSIIGVTLSSIPAITPSRLPPPLRWSYRTCNMGLMLSSTASWDRTWAAASGLFVCDRRYSASPGRNSPCQGDAG